MRDIFERIAAERGWNIDTQKELLYRFIDEVVSKDYSYCQLSYLMIGFLRETIEFEEENSEVAL